MLEVKTCPDCEKLFLKFSGRVCPECHVIRQQQLNTVIDFARVHPGMRISEICRICAVPERVMQDFAEGGTFRRLNLSIRYSCRLCAAPITDGTMCGSCREELGRQIVDLRSRLWGEINVLRPVQANGHYDDPFSPHPSEDPVKRAEAMKAISTRRSKERRSLRHAGHIR
ncbi:MAG: hypothetical protein KKB51_10330 [Candidatus Riflebacteria bacterium]|nr:hypothetical protein [Candidatus Riflebacteria bacterium]